MSKLYESSVEPVSASLCLDPPYFPRTGYITRAQLRGVKYEKEAQAALQSKYGVQYIPGPWFLYYLPDDARRRYCQCDGLLIDPATGRLTVVEIKLRHSQAAFNQLFHLYLPVVGKAFNRPESRPWSLIGIEVVHWFDCATPTQQPIRIRSDIHLARPGEYAVSIFNPKHKFKM